MKRKRMIASSKGEFGAMDSINPDSAGTAEMVIKCRLRALKKAGPSVSSGGMALPSSGSQQRQRQTHRPRASLIAIGSPREVSGSLSYRAAQCGPNLLSVWASKSSTTWA